MKKITLFLFVLMAFSFSSKSQIKYLDMLNDTNANFYDIKAEFESFWDTHPYTRGSGFNIFKRWAYFMEPRVYPSGNMRGIGPSKAIEELNNYYLGNPNAKGAAITATTSNWTPLGPFGTPVSGFGTGRLQCIRFNPSNPNHIFVGTTAGGLWQSTNSGASWTTNTDQLASLGVADIAVVPTNTNVMYLATGDRDGSGSGFSAGDTKSTGVLKSTDGGVTWLPTGLAWTTSQQRFIAKILINPLNVGEVFAFSSVGIYRTRDAGATWTQAATGNYWDAEYKPGDTATIYAANNANVWRSTNGGQTFANTTFNAVGMSRVSIAVTPADPNYLYVLGCKSSNYNFNGLYRSTNSAATFSTMSTTPNVLDGTLTGSSATTGQGWYDLALGASTSNKDEIMVGGVNTWKSVNGGSSWTINTCWNTVTCPGIQAAHSDCHDIIYSSGTTAYLGTDGGIFRTTNSGSTWTQLNSNFNISQPYSIGCSASNASLIIAGQQDNGSVLKNGATWTYVKSGDGMRCFIDWSNNNNMVATYVYGAFAKSTNGGASFGNIVTGLPAQTSANFDWLAPIIQDPTTANTYYCGAQQVFKSTNGGGSWAQIGAIAGGGNILSIYTAPSNSNYIYAARATTLFKTVDGGVNWTNITTGIPTAAGQIRDVCCSNTNPNEVYVVLSGYSSGNKVFRSTDGGLTWTNISAGLPNIPVNCIVYKNNSPGAIYVGTDVGVFYTEVSFPSFISFFTGLPNVWVNDLKIYYPTGKIRAATFGRGVWESDLYSAPGVAPNAFITNSYSTTCAGSSLNFADGSSNSPTSWSWSFPGGSPANSTAQNPPSITYAATGIYTVTLVSTNSVGASAPYSTTVSVINTPTSAPTNTGTCSGQPANLIVTTNAANCIWQGGQTGMTASFSPTITTVYGYTVYSGSCSSAGTATLTVGALPATPSITTAGNILTSTPATSYQWYLNGSVIPGATSQTYNTALTGDGFYSVWVGNGTGCENSSTAIYITVTAVNELSVFQALEVSPNPAKDVLNLSFNSSYEKEIMFTLMNTLGQTIKTGKIKPTPGEKSIISLDGISEGSYILNLSTSSSNATYKFIKQ